jgi:hypothetical protein
MIQKWIIRENKTKFKRHEAYNDLRSKSLVPSPEDLDGPLALLVAHGFLREQSPDDKKGPGRKGESTFLVNPHLTNQNNQTNQTNGKESIFTMKANSSDSFDCFDEGEV